MAKDVLTVDNPWSGEMVLERPLLSGSEVDLLMRRAQVAQLSFRKTALADRVALLDRFIDAFTAAAPQYAREITEEMGKPLVQAEREIQSMFDRARQMASLAKSALQSEVLPEKAGFERWISREPVGVVVVLAAWNYPLLIAINPIAAAVLSGNAVVIKHSSRTPRCGEQFQEAFEKAGAPKDLVTAVHASHEVTERIAQHPLAGYVSFTGSVGGGRKIFQAVAEKRFIDVGLELGGKDPAYVAEDAPFEFTASEIVDSAFYNAGQSCCAIERVYVAESIYERFLETVVATVGRYQLGDPFDPKTTIGPLAQPSASGFLERQVEEARGKGARILIGGGRTSVGGRGRFFSPTIAADTDHGMAIAREESFGPVLAIQSVRSDEAAVERMNDSAYGLTASVWTSDVDRAKRILAQLDAGTVFMNRADFLDPLLAWTGVKDSGKGVSLSRLGFLAVTRPKSYHLRTRLPVK